MESFKTKKPNVFLPLLILLLSQILYIQAVTPAGTIERTTKQQVLASLPPSQEPTPTGSSHLVLISPSGKYTVFLLRRETSLGAGGFGTDFCYVQVQDSGESVWESECTVISNVNTCSLVFSNAGLEIFDGSLSAWDTDVDTDDHEHLESIVLVDTGDMQIRNKDGELKWKASDNPIVNQNCGSIGAPGLAPAHPPFGQPIHGGRGPFGQPIQNQGQQTQSQVGFTQQPPLESPQESSLAPESSLGSVPDSAEQHHLENPEAANSLGPVPDSAEQHHLENPEAAESSLGQPAPDAVQGSFPSLNQPAFGRSTQQPLVDNTPFDSGSSRMKDLKLESSLVCIGSLLGYFGFLFM